MTGLQISIDCAIAFVVGMITYGLVYAREMAKGERE